MERLTSPRFAGTVKLHSILLRTSDSESAPKTLKVFTNREDLDFETAQDLEPTQTLELSRTNEVQDIAVKRSLFNNSYNLTLLFEDNFGADATEVFYIGLKGDFMRLNREPVEVLYEAAANPQDHAPIVGINNMASHSNQQGK
jgi:PITH domain